jgi:PEP-CTERM motif
MRLARFAAIAAFALVSVPVFAVPVSWNLESSVYRTNLPAFGIEVGDVLSVNMVVDTETPGVPTGFQNGYGYFNPFDEFTLSVNGFSLLLGPQLPANTVASRDSNWIGTANFPDYQRLDLLALMYESGIPYVVEARFEFTDTTAFPLDYLPVEPPSLASMRLSEFNLYQRVDDGGLIFIAGSEVTSFTVASVPEPGTLALALGAAGLMLLGRRRKSPAV